jgi:hypothetical protein
MRSHVILAVATFAIAMACSDDTSNTDGGPDATEEVVDICSEFTSAGEACPAISKEICFPVCEGGFDLEQMGGCECLKGDAGTPVWVCDPGMCAPGCGNTSPLNDAACDASDGGPPIEAGSEAGAEAGSDAGSDASDAAGD